MRPGRERRRRLVEADVPVLADPENLQIDPARGEDQILEMDTLRFEISGAPVEKMRAALMDIDVPEQMLAHVRAVAPQMRRLQAHEFIQIERRRLRVIRLAVLVQPGERTIQRQRRAARRQSQYESRFLLELRDDVARQRGGHVVFGTEYANLHVC